MAADNISKLRIYSDVWNAEGMTDENSLANAYLTQPDTISPIITHLAGREDKRFPLSFLTEGLGNYYISSDVEYDWPVMGRINKALQCVAVSGSGLGRTVFSLTFPEKWFVREYIISPGDNSFQAKIVEDPIQKANGWEYKCVLNTTESTDTVPSDVVGKRFVQLFAPVSPYGGSRGNESNWVAPSKMRNQITVLRKSYGYEGSGVPGKVVNIQLSSGSGTTKYWMDFEVWQHNLRWKEELETSYWYSKYNRDSQGAVHLKDLSSNKQVTTGAGVFEQIPNVESYSSLSSNKLKNVVRNMLYGASDAQKMNIVLFTGIGGLEEFDKAMKEDIAGRSYMQLDGSQFVTGSGANLMLGGFFTSYKHIDGHTITVRHLPLFDNGPFALASELHPITGLPLESYRMLFLDMSVYDGQANVRMVRKSGYESKMMWAVAGSTVPPGFSGSGLLRSSDIDGASVHFMQSSGIHIARATNCMHLYCGLS